MKVNLKRLSITQIEQMDKKELLIIYKQILKTDSPCSFLMPKRALIYKVQEANQVGMKTKYQKLLESFINNSNAITDRKETPNYQIHQGQKIIKEYRGRVYEVIKTETGFIYENQNYKSLSVIANKITGQKWSGPRFFNLRKRSIKVS